MYASLREPRKARAKAHGQRTETPEDIGQILGGGEGSKVAKPANFGFGVPGMWRKSFDATSLDGGEIMLLDGPPKVSNHANQVLIGAAGSAGHGLAFTPAAPRECEPIHA